MKKICPNCKLLYIPHPEMKHFRDNIFWTYTKKEDKNSYLVDIEIFTQYSYDFLVKSINYKFIDLILDNKSDIKNYIRLIKTQTPIFYYIHRDRMIYFYYNKNIFGLDLDLCEFIGLNKNKIKNKLSSLENTTLLTDEILIVYKSALTRLNDGVKYIPFLYALDEKNNPVSNILTTK